jgi:hypothetical protein
MFLSASMKRATCAANHLRVAMLRLGVQPVRVGRSHHHEVVDRPSRLSQSGLHDGGEFAVPGDLAGVGKAVVCHPLRHTLPVADRGDADLGDDRPAGDSPATEAQTESTVRPRPDELPSEGFTPRLEGALAELAQWEMLTRPKAPADDRRLGR